MLRREPKSLGVPICWTAILLGGCAADDGPSRLEPPRDAAQDAVGALDAGPEAGPTPEAGVDAGGPVDRCEGVDAVGGSPELGLQEVARGFVLPLAVVSPPGDPRFFVAERLGAIRVVRDGVIVEPAMLDISAEIATAGTEQGLLGMAVHPEFAYNATFYIAYTGLDGAVPGDSHVVELRVSPDDPDRADPATARELLHVAQPTENHNGGHLAFGPDDLLYVALGDGGPGGDPLGHAQDEGSLLGKLLHIDVADLNPLPQVWARGLRNPWRFSFDLVTGDLWLGDVGQDDWEEVDVLRAGVEGANLGWNVMEGSHCYPPGAVCDPAGLVLPVYEYGREEGCAVTGGVVYRGCRVPDYEGQYFFGDVCQGWVRSLPAEGGEARNWPALARESLVSFGEDRTGEILLLDYDDGILFRVVPVG